MRCRLVSPARNTASGSEPGMSPGKPASPEAACLCRSSAHCSGSAEQSWCLAGSDFRSELLTVDDGVLDRPP